MRDVAQLEKDFDLYILEIQRSIECECYWALLHVLLAIPDVCATLETNPANLERSKTRKRYVEWCNDYFSSNNISGEDRYQMRNALLHNGSTTLGNPGATKYKHFSYVTPSEYSVHIHGIPGSNDNILNVHPVAMAAETVEAIFKWFNVLQNDKMKMENVEKNINKLSKHQQKLLQNNIDGNIVVINGTTISST